MSPKRVILANNSRLLREMLQHIIHKAHRLEVVQVIFGKENLSWAITQLAPDWVVVSAPHSERAGNWLSDFLNQHPAVRFVVLSPDHGQIHIQLHASDGQDVTGVSLQDFIQILERDLEHT